MRWFCIHVALALLVAPLAFARKPTLKRPHPKRINITEHIDYLRVYSDRKGHVFVVADMVTAPRRKRSRLVFYGDGKRFYRQRTPGASRNGPRYSYSVYDPRMRYGLHSMFLAINDKGYFRCGKRKTTIYEITGAKRLRLLKSATFYDIYWRRAAHALLRDDDGVYYYVDRLWVPYRIHGNPHGADARGFHVYAGKRGKLKRLRMKNIVNDPQGQIFITTKGKLKLIVGSKPAWIAHGKRTALTRIDLTRSTVGRVLVYRQLGVYRGERLMKPCDDL